MTTTVKFAGNEISCRHLLIATGNLRAEDIIVIAGQMVRVETIQPNCPHIENINRVFTMTTCRDEAGNLVPVRAIGQTKVEVWRAK